MQWNRDCFKFKLLDSKKLYLGVYNHCGRSVCPSAKCDVGHATEWLEYGTAGSIQEHLATKIVCIQIFQHIKTERHSNFQIFYLKKFQGAAGLLEGCSIWLAPWAAAAGCSGDPQLSLPSTVGPWGACWGRGGWAGMRKEIPFASAWHLSGDEWIQLSVNSRWASRHWQAGIAPTDSKCAI